MQLIAEDTAGNLYRKTLKIEDSPHGPIIDLGGYCRYYYSDLTSYPEIRHEKMYLDVMGRNHRGYPVWISYRTLIRAIELKLKEKANEAPNHDTIAN